MSSSADQLVTTKSGAATPCPYRLNRLPASNLHDDVTHYLHVTADYVTSHALASIGMPSAPRLSCEKCRNDQIATALLLLDICSTDCHVEVQYCTISSALARQQQAGM
jgi:hypothetical protein